MDRIVGLKAQGASVDLAEAARAANDAADGVLVTIRSTSIIHVEDVRVRRAGEIDRTAPDRDVTPSKVTDDPTSVDVQLGRLGGFRVHQIQAGKHIAVRLKDSIAEIDGVGPDELRIWNVNRTIESRLPIDDVESINTRQPPTIHRLPEIAGIVFDPCRIRVLKRQGLGSCSRPLSAELQVAIRVDDQIIVELHRDLNAITRRRIQSGRLAIVIKQGTCSTIVKSERLGSHQKEVVSSIVVAPSQSSDRRIHIESDRSICRNSLHHNRFRSRQTWIGSTAKQSSPIRRITPVSAAIDVPVSKGARPGLRPHRGTKEMREDQKQEG